MIRVLVQNTFNLCKNKEKRRVNTPTLLAAENPSVAFVCLLGIAVVFIGLACIIGVILLMNFSVSRIKNPEKEQKQQSPTSPVPQSPVSQASGSQIQNRGEIIAAVCAAVAEENGTDISAIRVISFKKIS